MASLRMSVVKRDGKREFVNFDKITTRIERLCWPLGASPTKSEDALAADDALLVDASKIAATVCASVVDGITTERLDELTADAAAGMSTEHPDYGVLAARIVVSNLQKQTSDDVLETYERMAALLDPAFLEHVRANRDAFQAMVDYDRDFDFDYFGFKTMEKLYLTKVHGKIVERPQHMFLRVAVAIWGSDVDRVKETYDAMSTKMFTHASPTLFNAGLKNQQLSSCHAAGTKVSTVNRGPVNIEDVAIGDLVVTHAGSTKPVVQLHVNPLGARTLYDLKAYKTPIVSVTGNHRFWAIKSMKKMNGKNLVIQGQKPDWVSVDDLDVGDYIAIPKRKDGVAPGQSTIDAFPLLARELGETYGIKADENVIDITKNIVRPDWLNDRNTIITTTKKLSSVNRRWKINEEFAWFLGVWYGDGCVTGPKGEPYNVSIASNPNNVELIDRVVNIGRRAFGIEPRVRLAKKQRLATISFHSKALAVAFASLFGRGHLGKRLPDIAFDWDVSLVRALLGGLVSSDGCVSASGAITVSITNRPLLEGIYHLARQVGIDVSFRSAKKPAEWKHCPVWSMSIPRVEEITRHVNKAYDDDRMNLPSSSSTRNGIAIVGGVAYARVESKDASDKKDRVVYTLGVQDDHSYPVEGLVCENCFLLGVEDDSIAGIYDALTKCAHISKYGGGIGMHISNVRCKGSKIRGTNGESDGIVPMAKVFDATAAYVNQGGRRKGAIALYLEPHHPDVFEFLDLKRNQGEDSLRARNLFYAMWLPDLFMKRVETDDVWSLFDPAECPDLNDLYGDEFEVAYERLETQRAFVRQIKAQDLWTAIVRSQIETGGPYVLFKDAANRKSNQKNLGTIKCSNLCVEIMEYTSKDEIAVCTLGSLSLPAFVLETPDGPRYDFESLMHATKILARNLDRIIDINFYPLQEAKNSNERHRPVGIGVQGLANVFFEMKMPFDSPEAAELNRNIFETIYYGSLLASNELAKEHGPYSSYVGSPASLGKLQYDLWKTVPTMYWDWEGLKARIAKHGLRNSLSVAPMPTASTAQFMSNVEAMEPQTSNLYSRRTLAGEFPVINTQLVRELIARGTWDVDMKNKIVAHGGSIQKVIGIHPSIKAVYKTAWEMSMKTIIDMAADRGAFVCQSQSMNCFVAEPTMKALSSMHFYAWRKGLKTGCYYLRTKAASSAIKVTASCLSCSG